MTRVPSTRAHSVSVCTRVLAADSIGAAWRTRWDSLVLFTPRRYSALAGLAFPGDPDGYPTRDEVIDQRGVGGILRRRSIRGLAHRPPQQRNRH